MLLRQAPNLLIQWIVFSPGWTDRRHCIASNSAHFSWQCRSLSHSAKMKSDSCKPTKRGTADLRMRLHLLAHVAAQPTQNWRRRHGRQKQEKGKWQAQRQSQWCCCTHRSTCKRQKPRAGAGGASGKGVDKASWQRLRL